MLTIVLYCACLRKNNNTIVT